MSVANEKDENINNKSKRPTGWLLCISFFVVVIICAFCILYYYIEWPHYIASAFLDELARGTIEDASVLCDPEELRIVTEPDGGVRLLVVTGGQGEWRYPSVGPGLNRYFVVAMLVPQKRSWKESIWGELKLGRHGAIMNGRLVVSRGKVKFCTD